MIFPELNFLRSLFFKTHYYSVILTFRTSFVKPFSSFPSSPYPGCSESLVQSLHHQSAWSVDTPGSCPISFLQLCSSLMAKILLLLQVCFQMMSPCRSTFLGYKEIKTQNEFCSSQWILRVIDLLEMLLAIYDANYSLICDYFIKWIYNLCLKMLLGKGPRTGQRPMVLLKGSETNTYMEAILTGWTT